MRSRTSPWLRTFLIIFCGQAFSLLGSAAVNFALVWWLTAATGSATVLAYAAIAATLPQALLTPLAGPLVDRLDRRLTMIWADLFIAGTSLVLIAAFLRGDPAVWAVYALIGARSLGAAFHTPASQAAVPMYVPQEQLMRVAGWSFFLTSGVAMAAPVLGALLMSTGSMPLVFALDIAGAAIAVFSLLLVRIPSPERSADEPGGGLLAEFAAGWRELRGHSGLFALAVVLTVVTVLYMPINALFPLMTFEHFGGGAVRAAIVELAFGAGMLAGSLAVGALAARFSGARLISLGIAAIGLLLAASGLLPAWGYWAFAALCLAMGVSVPLFGAPLTAMFQARIDPSKLGRVLSLFTTMTMLVVPAGLLLAGPAAEATGVAAWFLVSGCGIAAAGAVTRLLPAVRKLDAAPSAIAPRETGSSAQSSPEEAGA